MDEYVCLTLLAELGEVEAAFGARLTAFWTSVLRTAPLDYEKVYAEATAFESLDHRVARRYMVELDGAATLAERVTAFGLACAPLDTDDAYSKYEAAPPEWFWIEH